jgi:transposase
MEILMSGEDQLILDVVIKVECQKILRKDACLILDVSMRTLERYIKEYRKKGPVFVVHGNSGKEPKNKTKKKVKEVIQKLIREKYHDFNMTHLREKLEEEEKIEIKKETLRKFCHEIHHVKRKKRRPSKVRHHRQRMESKGLLLQMDGSPEKWFGQKDSCLIAAIDDADSEIPYAEFFPAEDTISCMTVLQKIIEKRGVFHVLYVDRAGLFGGHKRAEFSQIKRALAELGIQIIFANSPEAKGRIERTFQTLQDRMIPEMRLKGINTYPKANEYLQKEFLPNQWKRYMVKPRNKKSEFRMLGNGINLKEIFCQKYYRSVKRDHTICWQSKIYSLTSPIKFSIHKQKIEIRVYQDLTEKAFYAGIEVKLTYIDDQYRYRSRQVA